MTQLMVGYIGLMGVVLFFLHLFAKFNLNVVTWPLYSALLGTGCAFAHYFLIMGGK